MRRIIIAIASAWFLTIAIAHTQSPPPTSRYRVLATNKLSTLQKELDESLAQGYRVVTSARPAAAVKVLVLERHDKQADYFISDSLARDLHDKKIQPGFRVLPLTVGATGNAVWNGPCGAVLERAAGDTTLRDYRVVEAVYPGNLQKDILNAAADRYRVVVIGIANEFCAVLERDPAASTAGAAPQAAETATKEKKIPLTAADYSRPYVVIATTKTSTLEKEIADAAAHGFRVHSGAAETDPGAVSNEMVYLMERLEPNAPHPEYLVLSTTRVGTLEREMNEAAARGYRLHPFSVTGVLKSLSGTFETVVVMEKRESPPIEYRVLGAARAGTFEREVPAAGEQGWELVAIVRSGAFTAIMQRAAGRD